MPIARVPRVFVWFPLDNSISVELNCVYRRWRKLKSLWQLLFFFFLRTKYLEIIILLMKLWGTVSPWELCVSCDIRRRNMTEVNYVDQVFLCFFLSLKLVTISDKENYERCYLENYVFCIPYTRLNIIFAYLSVLLSRLLLNLILKRYLHCLNSTSKNLRKWEQSRRN